MWSSQPVFVSSTFSDMQAERDHLQHVVFPALEERLRAHRRYLEWVDLRIGVPTAALEHEDRRELLILKVCLDEVRRCRPFLIVLLGDRYGWIPPAARVTHAAREAGFTGAVEGRSVTDLEIDFGVLQDPQQRSRSVFYFREPLPYDRMPPQVASQYADDEQGRARLDDLKQRITKAMPGKVHRYAVDWDARANKVAGLDAWGERVLEDLWREIEEDAGASRAAITPLEAFIASAGRDFVGRDALIESVLGASTGVCITGEAGSGKSAVFSELYRRLASRDVFVLAHAAGSGGESASVDGMLRHWIEQMAPRLGEHVPGSLVDAREIDRAFADLLARCAAREDVVLLIDALDQFEAGPRGRYLTWLPRPLPPRVRCIATAIPGTGSAALIERSAAVEIAMPPLDEIEARGIAGGICRRYHRSLEPEVTDALVAKPAAGGRASASPLWVVLATEALNLIDADDVEAARGYGGTPAERLRALMLDRVHALPGDVHGVYTASFEQARQVFGAIQTDTWLSLIAVSRSGWRESDFRALLPLLTGDTWNELRFAQLRRFFRGQIRQRTAMGLWDFAHGQMREAIRRHPLGASMPHPALHAAIASHLLALPNSDPLRESETMRHLLASGDLWRACDYYSGELTETEERGAAARLSEDILVHGSGGVTRMLEPGAADLTHQEFAAQRLMYQVFDGLRTRAPLETQQELIAGITDFFERVTSTDPDLAARASAHRAAALSRLGDVRARRGQREDAKQSYGRSKDIAERLVTEGRDTPEQKRDLSVSLNKTGQQQIEEGDLEGARDSLERSLQLLLEALRDRSTDIVWQRDAAITRLRLGDLQLRRGDREAARAGYAEANAIFRRIGDRLGDANSLGRLAKLDVASDDLDGAAARLAQAVAACEQHLDDAPDDGGGARLLVETLALHAGVERLRGNDDAAHASLSRAVRSAERLLKADPLDAALRPALRRYYHDLRKIQGDLGDLEGAQATYRALRALDRTEE